MRRFLPVLFCGLSLSLSGQAPTELWMFNLEKNHEGFHSLTTPRFLSAFNPLGYTNQPWFTPKSELLLSISKIGDDQHDIFQVNFSEKTVRQMTNTSVNEFSPRYTPDNESLSVLVQVPGDSIDQQVCRVPLSDGKYTSLTPGIKDVGYYAWLDKDHLALYRLAGDDNHLMLYDLNEQRSKRITSSVGRTLVSDQRGGILYIHKFDPDYWYLKRYNSTTMTIDILAETPGKSEDFAVTPDGVCIMGVGSKLFSLPLNGGKEWRSIGDLSSLGINQITRLAISPDGTKIVMVVAK